MNKWMAIIIALIVMSVPVLVLAQQAATPSTSPQGSAAGAQPEGKMDAGMMEKHKEWQARHEKMMEEMKAMDARLDEKVAAMNAAKGDQKVEAMAAVINELVAQRKAMRDSFGAMHHGMGGPMMGRAGGMPADCPMMKHGGCPKGNAPQKESSQ